MTLDALVRAYADRCNVSLEESLSQLQWVFDTISDTTLKKHERLVLPKFGVFWPKVNKARKMYDPVTKTFRKIKPMVTMKFRSSEYNRG